jgi:hypothetical protein
VGAIDRLSFIVQELLKCDPMRHEKVSQKYLAEMLDVERKTM